MPLDTRDRDPQWGAGFRMRTEDREAERLRKEAAARDAYAAETRRIAAGEQGLAGQPGAPVDKLKQAMAAPAPHRPENRVLNVIADGEGTGGPDGYDVTYGYGKYVPKGTKITEMSIADVRRLQDEMYARSKSTPVGRYQTTRATHDDFVPKSKIPWTERYSPDVQDKINRMVLGSTGYDRYLQGKLTASEIGEMQKQIAGRWDSVAWDASDMTNPATHKPHKAQTTNQELHDALAAEKAEYQAYVQRMLEEGRMPVPPKDWR